MKTLSMNPFIFNYFISILFAFYFSIFYANAQLNLGKIKEKAKQEILDKKNAPNPQRKTETVDNEPIERDKDGNFKAKSEIKSIETSNEIQSYRSYSGEIPPPAIIDDYGKKVGQILFSKKAISEKTDKVDKSALTNVFMGGDEVFAMAYLLDTKENLEMDIKGIRIHLQELDKNKVFGDTYAEYRWNFGYDKVNFRPKDGVDLSAQRHQDFDIFTYQQNAFDGNYPYEFLGMLIKHLEIPSYRTRVKKIFTFQVSITDKYGEKFAEGVFSYDLTSGGIEKLKEMYRTLNKKAIANVKLTSKRNDPALSAKILQVMATKSVKAEKIYFSTNDWGIIRHNISGAILRRSIWAYVVYKNEQGDCLYDDIQFTQEYIKGKFSEKVDFAGYGTANGQIDCANVK